jgi:hypothetical protein
MIDSTSRSRIFHYIYGDVTFTGEGMQTIGLCSALRTFEQGGGSLSCHTYCDTGPRFFRSHPKQSPIQSPLTTHEGMRRIYSNPDPHSVASYGTQWNAEDLFLPGPSQVCFRRESWCVVYSCGASGADFWDRPGHGASPRDRTKEASRRRDVGAGGSSFALCTHGTTRLKRTIKKTFTLKTACVLLEYAEFAYWIVIWFQLELATSFHSFNDIGHGGPN